MMITMTKAAIPTDLRNKIFFGLFYQGFDWACVSQLGYNIIDKHRTNLGNNHISLNLQTVKATSDFSTIYRYLSTDFTGEWSKENRRRINPDKTKEIVISVCKDHGQSDTLPNFVINDSIVGRVQPSKIIGVIVSNDLSWNKHIDGIITKASKVRGYMSCTSWNGQGLAKKSATSLFIRNSTGGWIRMPSLAH